MMLLLRTHGTGCCGARSICNFDGTVTADDINRLLAQTRQGGANNGMLVEAIVTNGQLVRHRNIAPALREAGFKLVTRFKNPNTGAVCNLFHYNRNPKRVDRVFGGITRDDIAERIG